MVRSTRITTPPPCFTSWNYWSRDLFVFLGELMKIMTPHRLKKILIEYINGTTVPDLMFIMSSVSEMTKDQDFD